MDTNKVPERPSLPEHILRRIQEHFYNEYRGVNMMPSRRVAEEICDFRRVREQLALMQQLTGVSIAGQRVLEMGSGYGPLQVEALSCDSCVFGLEPDGYTAHVSHEVLDHYGFNVRRISQSIGERMPFADNVFDVVCSFLVMEHVQDLQRVLSESVRVLRPGGYLHFVAPNYGSIWEGHYNYFWIPNSSPRVAKAYVRILGRNPDFVDTLQLITPRQVRRIVASLPLHVESWGIEIWEHRLEKLDFTSWSELETLKVLVQWARRLGLVDVVRWLGRRLDLFTPIILTAQKVA
ncbi:MAG: class I SAM-dependent methyltransferase [Anaerolineae bacterium]|nr:class I SAM-dependent methyltransferase [Anaerolineae bacterium]